MMQCMQLACGARQAVMGVYVPVIRLSAIVCSVLTLYTTACVALTVQRSLYDTTCHFYTHVFDVFYLALRPAIIALFLILQSLMRTEIESIIQPTKISQTNTIALAIRGHLSL